MIEEQEIVIAPPAAAPMIQEMVSQTIRAIYPRYYPAGAVDFFLKHHSLDNIKNDIEMGGVYLLGAGNSLQGTVTVKNNDILRLFVLPQYQHQGFGRKLLDFAEQLVARDYGSVCVDASFPAKAMYLKRGYVETAYHNILTENGDYLCYDRMEKFYDRQHNAGLL